MTVYSAAQFRSWEAYTMAHEPISALHLMERAAHAATKWILEQQYLAQQFVVFCGYGNNGADGLAIARLLHDAGKDVQVFLLPHSQVNSAFSANLQRLQALQVPISTLTTEPAFPTLTHDQLVIEALYGIGINRPLNGLSEALVHHLNQQPAFTISIDMPAGLPPDASLQGIAIMAQVTLTFQSPKFALFMAESEPYCGKWHVLDIGLLHSFVPAEPAHSQWVLAQLPQLWLKTYRKHANKSMLGHALISAGSYEKLGAAVMSAASCLRSGCGLLTMALPAGTFSTLQAALPEAMCMLQEDAADERFLTSAKIGAVGVGPGWSTGESGIGLLENMMVSTMAPLVIDATALYHLATSLHLLQLRPPGTHTILTPHTGEFARLFGSTSNGFERLELARQMAKHYQVFIVLKGAYTQTITPAGQCYFNSTGNPGMAKAGSGDVLTGILTSLLAQRYAPELACVLGVYVHGLAGDIAAQKFSQQGMKATDTIAGLPEAWKRLVR
ncbi:MAG: NAD(P)H-hydrate dehydratase [Bacteroidetes bacterium]|nr:MAG: NAD(P)H-hydrate dehydratase [Bacteroidota bacterium]